MSEDQREFLDYWYWSSVLSRRLSLSSNETIVSDSAMLRSVARGEHILPPSYMRQLRPIIEEPEDIIALKQKASALYVAVLDFVVHHARGLANWNNSSALDPEKVHDHHIFPKNYLRKYGIEMARINSVANRALIADITNIKIGDKAPGVYLPELNEANPGLPKALDASLVPKGLLAGEYDGDSYEDFLQTRATYILNVIRQNVTNKQGELTEKWSATEVSEAQNLSGTAAQDGERTDREKNSKRTRFSFSDCGIKVGEIVHFIDDPAIRAKVVDDRHVDYQGERMTLSQLAKRLKKTKYGLRGPSFFTYKGQRLTRLREEQKV